MSESKKNGIKLAPWVVTVSTTLLIAIMTITVRGSVRVGRFEANIDNNAKEIECLDENKSSNDKVDRNYDAILELKQEISDLNQYVRENK